MKWVISEDVAEFLYLIIKDPTHLSFVFNQTSLKISTFLNNNFKSVVFRPAFPLYTQEEIKNRFEKWNNGERKLDSFTEIFNNMLYYKNPINTYVTIVYPLDDSPRMDKTLGLLFFSYQEILSNLYPNLPIEIIIVYSGSMPFKSHYFMSDILKKHIKVYQLPSEYYSDFRSISFPDYISRNFGIVRSKSPYIFAGSADVIPSALFFETVSKRSFSPLSFVHHTRKEVEINDFYNIQNLLKSNYLERTSSSKYLIEWENSDSIGNTNQICSGPLGDFEGGHHDLLYYTSGFIDNDKIASFRVDRAFCHDYMTMPGPPFFRFGFVGYHMSHIKESRKRPWFNLGKNIYQLACGIKSDQIDEYKRPNWGHQSDNISPIIFPNHFVLYSY